MEVEIVLQNELENLNLLNNSTNIQDENEQDGMSAMELSFPATYNVVISINWQICWQSARALTNRAVMRDTVDMRVAQDITGELSLKSIVEQW